MNTFSDRLVHFHLQLELNIYRKPKPVKTYHGSRNLKISLINIMVECGECYAKGDGERNGKTYGNSIPS